MKFHLWILIFNFKVEFCLCQKGRQVTYLILLIDMMLDDYAVKPHIYFNNTQNSSDLTACPHCLKWRSTELWQGWTGEMSPRKHREDVLGADVNCLHLASAFPDVHGCWFSEGWKEFQWHQQESHNLCRQPLFHICNRLVSTLIKLTKLMWVRQELNCLEENRWTQIKRS